MKRRLSLKGLAFLLVLLVLHAPIGCVALAAAASDTTVNFQPLLSQGMEILGMVLLALASWAATWLARKLKLDSLAPELERIVEEGVKYGTNKLKRLASDKGKVDVQSEIAAEALGYVTRNGPKAMKALGYSQEQIRDKILSRIKPDGEEDDQASAGSGA